MIIDISSYNGKIDFEKMAKEEDIERFILRSTRRDGKIDPRFEENLKGLNDNFVDMPIIDVYKFSYARSFEEAAIEAAATYHTMGRNWGFINNFWLDLEPWGDKGEHSKEEVAAIIAAYKTVFSALCPYLGFGIYCNYNYLNHLLPEWAYHQPLWIAKWSTQKPKTDKFTNAMLWQYTNTGKVAGINGDVDLSRSLV